MIERDAVHRVQIGIDDVIGGLRHRVGDLVAAAIGRLVLAVAVKISGLVEQIDRRGTGLGAEVVEDQGADDGADQGAQSSRKDEAADRAEQLAADRAFAGLRRHQFMSEVTAEQVAEIDFRDIDRAGHRLAPIHRCDGAREVEAAAGHLVRDLGEQAGGKAAHRGVEQLAIEAVDMQRVAQFGGKER